MPAGKRLLVAAAALAAGLPAAAEAATRIAYSNLSTYSHVHVMNGNGSGSGKSQLTSGSVNDFDAVFSPTGRLVFVRGRQGGRDDLYRLASDGTNLTRLTRTRGAEADPVWSPQGGRLACEYGRLGGSTEIVVLQADGTGRRRLTRNSVDDVGPTWSPGGTRVAFTRYVGGSNAEIYSVGADGTGLRRLTSTRAAELDPNWSSGGKIAFARLRANGSTLVVTNGDGSGARALWRTSLTLRAPVWSPNGRHIALEVFDGNDTELYVVSAEGVRRRLHREPHGRLRPRLGARQRPHRVHALLRLAQQRHLRDKDRRYPDPAVDPRRRPRARLRLGDRAERRVTSTRLPDVLRLTRHP